MLCEKKKKSKLQKFLYCLYKGNIYIVAYEKEEETRKRKTNFVGENLVYYINLI